MTIRASRTPGNATLIIDHERHIIRNAAIIRVGPHKQPRVGDAIAGGQEVLTWLRAINRSHLTEIASDGPVFPRSMPANLPELLDARMFNGGPTDHLAPLHWPMLRLMHPEQAADYFRLDLVNCPGAAIGRVASAWLDGKQLRADLHFADDAPLDGWQRCRDRLLLKASIEPWDLGISIASVEIAGQEVPIGVDLVSWPAANAHGLLGTPIASFQSIGKPAMSAEEWEAESRQFAQDHPELTADLNRRNRARTAERLLTRHRLTTAQQPQGGGQVPPMTPPA